MARTLTPEEWAELLRAQREGGIPNVASDYSTTTQGTQNPWGDLPTRGDQREFQQRTTGYPQGGLRGILSNIGKGISEDVGGFKDWVGGLVTPQTRSGSVEAPSGSLMDLKPDLEPLLGIGEENPVDQLYQALLNSEHRNDTDRINPWIQNKQGSSAWGPVQILKSLMSDAPKMVNLTPKEEDYVSRYQNDQQTVSPEDKILYTSIAKKLIQNYWDKYKDPLRVVNAWRWGPRGSAPSTQYFGLDKDGNRMYGLEKDISKPGSLGSDPDYWKEFRKVMGL